MAAANYYMELAELPADISQRVANSSLPIGCLFRDDAPSPQERIPSIQWNPHVSLSIKAPSATKTKRNIKPETIDMKPLVQPHGGAIYQVLKGGRAVGPGRPKGSANKISKLLKDAQLM